MTEAVTSAFKTIDTFDAFCAEGHNPRTRTAWDQGVLDAATGRRAEGYSDASHDYRMAYLGGYNEALRRFVEGESWRCENCRAEHQGRSAR